MKDKSKNIIRDIWEQNAIRKVLETGWGVYGKVSYKILFSIINAFFFSIPLICKLGFIGIIPAVALGLAAQLIPIMGSFLSIFGCVWAIVYTESFTAHTIVINDSYVDEDWIAVIIWIFEALWIVLFLIHIVVSIVKTKKALKAKKLQDIE